MSYANIDEAVVYFTARGQTAAWAAHDSESQSSALLFATNYIDGVYGSRFTGTPSGENQEWPRINAVDIYDQPIAQGYVPAPVKQACFIAALYELDNPGVLWPAAALDPAKQVMSQATGPLKKQFFDSVFGDPIILQSIDQVLRRVLSYVPAGIVVIQ